MAKNPFGFGFIRRADGKSRTVQPTRKSLALLKKVYNWYTKNPENWISGTVGNPERGMCIMGALTHFGSNGKIQTDFLAPSKEKEYQNIFNATELLIETINGNPRYDRDEGNTIKTEMLTELNDFDEYWGWPNDAYDEETGLNDNTKMEGYRRVMNALERTIQYAEKQIVL